MDTVSQYNSLDIERGSNSLPLCLAHFGEGRTVLFRLGSCASV